MKAQGDGWFTTITLIEGENIFSTDTGVANPYVVFTCNGKSRTSSVKLRTSQPNWRGRCACLFKPCVSTGYVISIEFAVVLSTCSLQTCRFNISYTRICCRNI